MKYAQMFRSHHISCRTFVSEFEATVKADSFPFLTDLHSAIQTYLPSELRDMVYAYLLPSDRCTTTNTIYFRMPDFDPDFHANTEWYGNDHYHSVWIDSEVQASTRGFVAGTQDVHKPGGWLLNPSYVGKGMARDLAEIYYSSYSFGLDMRVLKTFLHDDPTDTGFKPAEHIRKQLYIDVVTTRCCGWIEGAWASTKSETDFLHRIYTTLGELRLLSHIQEIPIRMNIKTSPPSYDSQIEGDRRFYNIMETVREPIYDLLHSGVNLEVWHYKVSSGKTRIISKEPWNFFRASKESWQDERQTHGPSWRPSSNFVTREDCNQDTLRQLLAQRWGLTELMDFYASHM